MPAASLHKLRAVAGLFGFLAATVASFWLVFAALDLRAGDRGSAVRVGSKADTEGILLAEIFAQLLEQRTELSVVRRTNLGGTQLCFEALRRGEVDMYPEYTGTALVGILRRPALADEARTLALVRDEFARRYGLIWLDPLAFNNTYALAVKRETSQALGLRTLSQLRSHPELRAGFTAEFLARSDGYPGLRSRGIRFSNEPRSMEAGLMYGAVASGAVDVISAYATDGRIDKLELSVLKDDLGFFPPYQAAPLVRAELLARHPEIRRVLSFLAGRIDDTEMRRLNAAVDLGGRSVADVARDWLSRQPRP